MYPTLSIAFEKKFPIFLAYVYFVSVALIYMWRHYDHNGLDLFNYLAFEDIAILTIAAWFGPFIAVPIVCIILAVILFLASFIVDFIREDDTIPKWTKSLPVIRYFPLQVRPSGPNPRVFRLEEYRKAAGLAARNVFYMLCNMGVLFIHGFVVLVYVLQFFGHLGTRLVRGAAQLAFRVVGDALTYVQWGLVVTAFVAPYLLAVFLPVGNSPPYRLPMRVMTLEKPPTSSTKNFSGGTLCTLAPKRCVPGMEHVASTSRFLIFRKWSKEQPNPPETVVVVPRNNFACFETKPADTETAHHCKDEEVKKEARADIGAIVSNATTKIVGAIRNHSDGAERTEQAVAANYETTVRSARAVLERVQANAESLGQTAAGVERTEQAVAANYETAVRGAHGALERAQANAESLERTAAGVERTEQAVAANYETAVRGAHAALERVQANAESLGRTAAGVERTEQAVAANYETVVRGANTVLERVEANAESLGRTAAGVERTEQAVAANYETALRGTHAALERVQANAESLGRMAAGVERTEQSVAANYETAVRGANAVLERVQANAESLGQTAAGVERTERAVAANYETAVRGTHAALERVQANAESLGRMAAGVERTEQAVAANYETAVRGTSAALKEVERSTAFRERIKLVFPRFPVARHEFVDRRSGQTRYLLAGFDTTAYILQPDQAQWISAFHEAILSCAVKRQPRLQIRGFASTEQYRGNVEYPGKTPSLCRPGEPNEFFSSNEEDKSRLYNCRLGNRRLASVAAYVRNSNENVGNEKLIPTPEQVDVVLEEFDEYCGKIGEKTGIELDKNIENITLHPWCKLGAMRSQRMRPPEEGGKQPHFLNRSVHYLIDDSGDCKGL